MLFTSAQPSETTQASAGTVNKDHLEKKQVMLQVDLGNIQVHFGSIWGLQFWGVMHWRNALIERKSKKQDTGSLVSGLPPDSEL